MTTPEAVGGDGMLHALLLDGHGGARALNSVELAGFHPETTAVWLHFNFEHLGAREWLESRSGLNSIAQNALLTPQTRPRTINRGDNLLRYIEGLDEVRERAAVAQEELITRASEEMNRRSYVFTVVATLFLPLGFFTGLLGINVGGIPGADYALAFWIVVGICIGLSGAAVVVFRLNRWL